MDDGNKLYNLKYVAHKVLDNNSQGNTKKRAT